ncbi:unnamed protein product [Brassica napus]|nr:unnamed protein product [Brassica napus]
MLTLRKKMLTLVLLGLIRLTWTVQSIKTRAYVQISTRISPREGPAC